MWIQCTQESTCMYIVSKKVSFLVWFWFFTSQSTTLAMLGWSVHLTTLFSWASLTNQLTSTSCTYFHLQLTTTLLESVDGRRMTVEIISWSFSSKVWDWAGIKLVTPGSSARHISAAWHVSNCAMRPRVSKKVYVYTKYPGKSIQIQCPVILFGILGSYLFLHIWENILLKLGK